MGRYIRRRFLSCVLALAPLQLWLAIPAAAESGGLDLVVLVDQSGSMSGTAGAGVANDSLGVRNLMVRFTLDLLAKDAKLNQVNHRLGVVSFGSEARVDLPLTEIRPDTVEAARQAVDAMRALPSLGNTHFLAAFDRGRQMFAGVGRDPGRRRAVILITDGAPFVESINVARYEAELQALVASAFPHPDYSVLVVALNDPSSDYWERYRDFWRDLSQNQARKLEGDREQVFKALHEVVTELLGTVAPRVVGDSLTVAPYLESLVFDVFSVDPEVSVQIHYPDGTPLSPDGEGVEVVTVGEIIRTLSVERPPPGLWRIEKSDEDARVEIFYQQFFPRGELLEPAGDAESRQYERVAVAYRVVDADGAPIQELPGYPLTLELALVQPDGNRSRFEMERRPELGEAVYRTPEAVECDQPGRYGTEVLIATKDLNDQPVTIFRDQWSGFTVRQANRIDCRIERPRDLSRLPLFRSLVFLPRPVDLEFHFVDEEQQPINLPAVFSGPPEELLHLRLLRNGHPLTPKVELTDRGGGVVRGRIQGLGRLGEHLLEVRPERSQMPVQYSVRVVPPAVTFRRTLELHHWAQLAILALAVVSSATLGGRALWTNLRYPLRGTLYIDRLGGRQLREYSLKSRRNRMTLKDLPVETQIVKLVVRARRHRRGGVLVTALGNKKRVLLNQRTLTDRGQTMLQKVPYVLRYKA